ncbi:cell envelope integrity protein CreD [Roseomonas sp. GC11]|uniref:cell envelope integrity protein CreD n=1 Tax=Roseomonas sp. GC11 TaxID=2950546 RepID=UPI00210E755E|nr:cell envelope integrity protein CreD [Roseomonas sp. GC11]MCQ4160547.1 cell envelope integrity protein CreD [Roseomonas sp. GC11]
MTETLPSLSPLRRGLPGPGKLGALAVLLAVLLVPTLMIGDVIGEREARQQEVQREIARKWGAAQMVHTPVLVVPYRALRPVAGEASSPGPGQAQHQAHNQTQGNLLLLPATLRAEAVLSPASRQRGLFSATVYTAATVMEGEFLLGNPGMPEGEILWDAAYVMASSTDLRDLPAATPLQWDGASLAPEVMLAETRSCPQALRWPVRLAGPPAAEQRIPFRLQLDLRGTQHFGLRAAAARAEVTVSAPWPTPGFAEALMPDSIENDADGFSARWVTAQQGNLLRRSPDPCMALTQTGAEAAGVTLLEPVPTYRMVNRTAKYALLFLVLAFTTYLLFELLARLRIHLVHYGLLGCAVVLFPLLLLALGEPLGFGTAYLISALAVAAQTTLFTAGITRWGLGLVFGGVLAALYGVLYIVLGLESYALLAGSLLLFAVLSLVMAVARRVPWESLNGADACQPAQPGQDRGHAQTPD